MFLIILMALSSSSSSANGLASLFCPRSFCCALDGGGLAGGGFICHVSNQVKNKFHQDSQSFKWHNIKKKEISAYLYTKESILVMDISIGSNGLIRDLTKKTNQKGQKGQTV